MADMQQQLEAYKIDPNMPKADEEHPWLKAARWVFDQMGGSNPDAGVNPIAGLSLKNPANIEKLLQMMANDTTPGAYTDRGKQAFAFMKAKYPKLFGIPSNIVERNTLGGRTGEYVPFSKMVKISNSQKGYFPSRNIPQTTEDMVNSLGHEIVHSLQQKRGAWNTFDEYKATGPYHENPFEFGADRGGDTAKTAYQRFIDMLNNPQQ